MNPQDILRGMMGGQQSSNLLTPPTIEQCDEFINRAMNQEDFNLHMLHNDLVLKLNPPSGIVSMLSVYEGEIFPYVLDRINERIEKGE